jgi:hypothetical protein
MKLADVKNITETAFIKPAEEKYFTANIYQSGTQLSGLSLPPETPILVSEPVNWEIEFCCFISDRTTKAIF